MNEFDVNNDFDFLFSDEIIQDSNTLNNPYVLERERKKIELVNLLKQEKLQDYFSEIPKQDKSYHIISNGCFDFFSFIPVLVKYLNGVEEFCGSTWTMNRNNVLDLLALFDTGKIKSINLITGVYFKQRESAVYATLTEGLQARKQRLKSIENHAKVVLLHKDNDFIVIEGSANFTANPRIEQYTINNNKEIYEFHKSWMNEIFKRKSDGKDHFSKRKTFQNNSK